MQPDAGLQTDPYQTSSNTRLTYSAGLAGVATLASRVLGLAREIVLAAVFGAGNEMDAFSVAFRIPNLTRDLFAEGAMSAAFVPTFTTHLATSGKDHAWRLANNVLTVLLLSTGAIVVLGVLFARPVVTAYAGDFAAVPGKLELTIWLTRVMLPFLMLVAVAAMMMGMLNSLGHYFLPSLAPAAFNVASILCAVVLVPLMTSLGLPAIAAMAVAVLLGGAGQMAIQWMPLRAEGFHYRPRLDWSDPGLRRALLLVGPGTLGLAATQINFLVTTQVATSQGIGAVSWLNYAFRLMYLPIGLFGVSIATAVLPQVARHAAFQDRRSVRDTVSHALSLMLMVNVPAMFGLLVLATPIVKLLLEHGRFAASDTIATAAVLRYYAIGLVGYSAVRILSPVFYALGSNRVPVVVSAIAVILNAALSLWLVNPLGVEGLALATSIAATVNAGALLLLLRRHLHRLNGKRLARSGGATLLAGGAMALVVSGVDRWIAAVFPDSGYTVQAFGLMAAIVCGLVTLGVIARVFRLEEFGEASTAIKRRVQKLLTSE
jgi:putative peptidoglycan lipid II flippase